MPGSIHLSVTEWGEITPRGLINTPYSIKVSVGNNQYQSVGREDFSFPVTTIREDVIIMLCNSGGNVVAKEEVKTISIAEKGDAEIVFPLQYGGNLKLKLSFVLNEQEKEKIRQMRSSVLKRKHEELIKGTHGIYSPGTSIQVTSKDYTKLNNQKVPKISTEPNRNKIEGTLIQVASTDNTKLSKQEVPKMLNEPNQNKIEGTLMQVRSKDNTKLSNQEVPKISSEPNRNKIKGTLIQVASTDNTKLSNQEVPKMLNEPNQNKIEGTLIQVTSKDNTKKISTEPNRNKIEGTLIQGTSKDNTKLSNPEVPKILTEPNRSKIKGTSIQVTSKDNTKLSNQKVPKISTEPNRNKIEEHGPPHLIKEKKKVSFQTKSQSGDDLTGANNQRSVPSVPNENRSDNIKKMINAIESNAKQNLRSQISRRTPVKKSAYQTSIGSMSYENEDIKERRVSQTIIRRSFSAGNLAEAILQNDPNFMQTPYLNETPGSISNERSVEVNMGSTETNLLQEYVVSNQQKKAGLPNKINDERVENLGSQISPRRTPVNRSAYQTSTGSMSYENEDIKERRVSQIIIRRSFSAGNLAEAILQDDPNIMQTPYLNETPVNRSVYQTSIGSMPYENEDIKETRVSQTIIRRSFSAGNLEEAILQDDPNITQTPYFDESTPGSVSNERSVEVNMGSRKTNLLQEYVVSNQQKKGGLPNDFDERVEVNIENMVTELLHKPAVRHQYKEVSLSNKVFDGNMFDVENFHGTSPYLDQGTSRFINERSCMDRTSYCYELSGMLMPHHLCLTSAPKKVMNFLESFTTTAVHKEKGAASDEVRLDIGSRSETDDPQSQRAGISILNGWGTRIFIVIAACGTIIFNTR